MMKHAIKSFCAGEERSGETGGYIFPSLINGGALGGAGVSEPARSVGGVG